MNWTSAVPGDSVVRFGTGKGDEQEVRIEGSRTLHHVEIPLAGKVVTDRYGVRTGEQSSPEAVFKAYPTDELRGAVAADWQGQPDLPALLKDDPHLLLTAGDYIARIHGRCGTGDEDSVTPYAELIDAYPGPVPESSLSAGPPEPRQGGPAEGIHRLDSSGMEVTPRAAVRPS